jgi:hypothetical protein
LALAVPLSRFTPRVGGGSAFVVRLFVLMKIFLSILLFACVITSAKAQSLDPSDVLKQDGILRISDGSSYWEFNTNGTFRSFPVGVSGRVFFAGTWTSSADPNVLRFTVTAKRGWMNGGGIPQDDWRRIVIIVTQGHRLAAKSPFLATFDCYWIIDELEKIPKPAK